MHANHLPALASGFAIKLFLTLLIAYTTLQTNFKEKTEKKDLKMKKKKTVSSNVTCGRSYSTILHGIKGNNLQVIPLVGTVEPVVVYETR